MAHIYAFYILYSRTRKFVWAGTCNRFTLPGSLVVEREFTCSCRLKCVGAWLQLSVRLVEQVSACLASFGPGESSRAVRVAPLSRGRDRRRRAAGSPAADAAALLAIVRWDESGSYVREFSTKYPLPQVARVLKGQYMGLGVPSLSSPTSAQSVFLTSAGRKLKIAAHCVKFKGDNRNKVVPVGTKLAIPDTYNGWFEILSEDGRSARVIESVAELARRHPDSCLVRETIKAYVGKGDAGEALTDKTRPVPAGTTLVLVGEVVGASSAHVIPAATSNNAILTHHALKSRFLRCFDQDGESVYLSFEQKGKFSPIARSDGLSGVHNVRQLLRMRFPLMVRLVHGPAPSAAKTFLPEMRLYTTFQEECLMALPLLKDPGVLVPLPLNAPLKLQGPKNADQVLALKEHVRIAERCRQLLNDVQDRIQVFDIALSKELRTNQGRLRRLPLIRRSVSDPIGNITSKPPTEVSVSHCSVSNPIKSSGNITTNPIAASPPSVPPTTSIRDGRASDPSYDEIDQIYDYVRGFAPLPKVLQNDFQDMDPNRPPIPPPIETIPARRHSMPAPPPKPLYERMSKKADEAERPVHRFLKSPAQIRQMQQRARFFRQSKIPKDNTKPVTTPITTKVQVRPTATSPLFHIRYKSLTNLANPDFNTLDSSNSAGSGGSAPKEKRSRPRLPRPRSLNNLLWDLQRTEMTNIQPPAKRLGTLYL